MTFMDHLNSPKLDFMQNWSGGKIVKLQQSQALTSHFEGFWSIVEHEEGVVCPKKGYYCNFQSSGYILVCEVC